MVVVPPGVMVVTLVVVPPVGPEVVTTVPVVVLPETLRVVVVVLPLGVVVKGGSVTGPDVVVLGTYVLVVV